MPIPSHILSFSTDKKGDQLFIHADANGLDHLIRSLTHLRRKLAENICDHDHLMTDAWGGRDLTDKGLEPASHSIHHVKIYGWTDEWAVNHGLRSQESSS